MRVRLVYFAWVRERIGKADETVDLPPTVTTITDVMAWLAGRGPEYGHAFENAEIIRAAIDKAHVKPTAAVAGASEIAFFPPVTGG
jgi:sulfur-carrier protein